MKKLFDMLKRHDRRWQNVRTETDDFKVAKNRLQALLVEFFAQRPSHAKHIDSIYVLIEGSPVAVGADELYREVNDRRYVLDSLNKTADSKAIARVLCCWFLTLNKFAVGEVDGFAEKVSEVLDASRSLNIRLVKRSGNVLVCRAGARLLDEALVDEVLEWLSPHPLVLKHFEEALKTFQSNDRRKYRNLLDDLRFALEQLARELLGNKKSLENQKALLLKWASERGLHQQVGNMLESLLAQFCQYQNEAVKHHENFGTHEIEFMIYLTGTFMRLLLELGDS